MKTGKTIWTIFECNYFRLLMFALLVSPLISAQATSFPIVTAKSKVSILYGKGSPKLDSITASLLAQDIERVTSYKPEVTTDLKNARGNVIVIGTIETLFIQQFISKQSIEYENLKNKWECYCYKTINKPLGNISKALIITGSNPRGMAYGVFALSKKIGVSPWYWWADVPVKRHKELLISQADYISHSPVVRYRGIFINDEDWGLQPWAAKTFEPETKDIGPKTYAKVFELLLRLNANLIWPAMHPSTKAFFSYPGNITVAEDYQIIIGSSHAEPMLRNNVGEWKQDSMGHFNYFTNKEKIYQYWEDRIKQSKGLNAIYTLGMRGVHDGQMEGIKDLRQAVPVIDTIIEEQRDLLSKYINRDIRAVPQVLTPYKEVLDIYDYGLKVPDDVTLVWPDDNFGYISRLNNEKEMTRRGGAGVYYHASYWGRPHDYLWLPSTHPGLMREELLKAYASGAHRLWVLNVGDIKPQEYNIQQFMDMAYNPNSFAESNDTKKHFQNWLTSIFGQDVGQEATLAMWEYYQLAYERKPEFMGWSQTEPDTKTSYTAFNHFNYGDEAQRRLDRYDAITTTVRHLKNKIQPGDADAFYELIYYPVVCASWINKKFLYRDKAYLYGKQNRLSAFNYSKLAGNAYDSIVKETEYYNAKLSNGKWEHVMSMNPRNLSVYQRPDLPEIKIDSNSTWEVLPEGITGIDSSSLQNKTYSVPRFDNLNRQRYFIDIFLCKHQQVKWSASVSDSWIQLSKKSGVLSPIEDNAQVRLWVTVNWDKVGQHSKLTGKIIFSDGSKQLEVIVHADNKKKPQPDYKGFVSNNGVISMFASHPSRQISMNLHHWVRLNDLGYSNGALEALPITIKPIGSTNQDSIKRNNSSVEFDFLTDTAIAPTVIIYSVPTHPVNNNFGVRYAIGIDESPLQIIETRTYGRSEEWKQNVLRNRAEKKIPMPFLSAGKHTLKIYAVDPGVILDQILIDIGGMKPSYSSIGETKIR